METWKDVKGYEGSYKVSSLGSIKSVIRFKVRTERILKQHILKGGYKYVELCLKGVRKKYLVHRLEAIAFIDNPENKPQVNHKNGIKTDNKLGNLEWNTRSENQKHAIKEGLRTAKGEKNSQSKLNKYQVIDIRQKVADSYSTSWLARMYGVSPSTISDIKARRSWKHI
tara:strand:+ start:371 stop:877 length:507 start_codon:yes stop_codon:yes gene_type:complete